MDRALALARAAGRAGEVPVGAVVVCSETGDVLGEGANGPISACDPTAHAEIVALRAAAKATGNYRLTGAVLYVTLEPCAMCAGAISLARVGRVVFAASDPKGGAVIHGAKVFDQPTCHWRPDVEQDPAAAAASDLLKAFFRARR
ncbi:MAG: nucleoside deaminase [Pseudomonadota bacterium]